MVSGIVRKLESQGENEVRSDTIGEMVMEALAHLDPVAYVRYASVYRDFRETSDFADFIEEAGKTKRSLKS
jgi:transcriptional repressor NrdR